MKKKEVVFDEISNQWGRVHLTKALGKVNEINPMFNRHVVWDRTKIF